MKRWVTLAFFPELIRVLRCDVLVLMLLPKSINNSWACLWLCYGRSFVRRFVSLLECVVLELASCQWPRLHVIFAFSIALARNWYSQSFVGFRLVTEQYGVGIKHTMYGSRKLGIKSHTHYLLAVTPRSSSYSPFVCYLGCNMDQLSKLLSRAENTTWHRVSAR